MTSSNSAPQGADLPLARTYGDVNQGNSVGFSALVNNQTSNYTPPNPERFMLRDQGQTVFFERVTGTGINGTPPSWRVGYFDHSNPLAGLRTANGNTAVLELLGVMPNDKGEISGTFDFSSERMRFDPGRSVVTSIQSNGTRIVSDSIANTATTYVNGQAPTTRYWDGDGWRTGMQTQSVADPTTGHQLTMINFDNTQPGQPTGMFIERETNTRVMIYGEPLVANRLPSRYTMRAEYDATTGQCRHPGRFLYFGQTPQSTTNTSHFGGCQAVAPYNPDIPSQTPSRRLARRR